MASRIKPFFSLADLKWRITSYSEPLSMMEREVFINVESRILKLALERLKGLAYLMRKLILKALGIDEKDQRFDEYMDELFAKIVEKLTKR